MHTLKCFVNKREKIIRILCAAYNWSNSVMLRNYSVDWRLIPMLLFIHGFLLCFRCCCCALLCVWKWMAWVSCMMLDIPLCGIRLIYVHHQQLQPQLSFCIILCVTYALNPSRKKFCITFSFIELNITNQIKFKENHNLMYFFEGIASDSGFIPIPGLTVTLVVTLSILFDK